MTDDAGPTKGSELRERFTIRMATLDDIEPGIALYRRFVAETGMAGFPFDDPDEVRRLMTETIKARRAVVGEMADGTLGGTIAVRPARFPHSTREYLADLWYFVSPEARATGLARRLLEAARDYAAKCGLPALFAPMAGTDPPKVDRFYSMLGFNRIGGVYLWTPPREKG